MQGAAEGGPRVRRWLRSAAVAFVVWLAVVPAVGWADTIAVGQGVNQAGLYLEFSDGAIYQFEVAFGTAPADMVTGLGLFDILESETDLTTVRMPFGDDVFIDGISFDGHDDAGFGGGDNWWHYWTWESDTTEWAASTVAVNDRLVGDGDADGWVYGRAGVPVPEPGMLMLWCCGALVGWRHRRQLRWFGREGVSEGSPPPEPVFCIRG